MNAVLRDGEQVTALELFDLVVVLAISQCTALMAHDPTRTGLAQGLLVLGGAVVGVVGNAWLTSVVDPEEGAVRFVISAAMAALVVVALCVPDALGNQGLTFAVAYGVVRTAHISTGRPRARSGCWRSSSIPEGRSWSGRTAGGSRRHEIRSTTRAAVAPLDAGAAATSP